MYSIIIIASILLFLYFSYSHEMDLSREINTELIHHGQDYYLKNVATKKYLKCLSDDENCFSDSSPEIWTVYLSSEGTYTFRAKENLRYLGLYSSPSGPSVLSWNHPNQYFSKFKIYLKEGSSNRFCIHGVWTRSYLGLNSSNNSSYAYHAQPECGPGEEFYFEEVPNSNQLLV